MSKLISTANFLVKTDFLGYAYQRILALADSVANVASPTAGTLQKEALNDRDATVALGTYEQEVDLETDANTMLGRANAEALASYLAVGITSLNNHCQLRGSVVNSSIVDIATFLAWYNGGDAGVKFRTLVTPQFAALFLAMTRANLAAVGVQSPAVNPTLTSGISAEGMGSRVAGGAFAAGTAVSNSLYSEVLPLIEVVTDLTGGAAHPVVAVAGTDDTGATTTTWSLTMDANEPTSAIATTITPAVNAMSRQTVALGSVTGIVTGSVLVVNSGLVDQETIVVENVIGSTIVAAFQYAHTAGAAITGKQTYALTPSVSGRRLRSVSGLTITVSTGGKIRVVGAQDRCNI